MRLDPWQISFGFACAFVAAAAGSSSGRAAEKAVTAAPQTAKPVEKPSSIQPPKTAAKPLVTDKIENEPFMTGFLDSAAHFYQVDRGLVAFALARSQLDLNTDTKTADIRNSISRSGIEALAVYAPYPIIRGGISFYRLNDHYDSGITANDVSFDSKRVDQETNYTPFAEIDLQQAISLGVDYALTVRTQRTDDRDTKSVSSSRLSSSAVFHRPGFELGIAYRPTLHVEETGINQIETGSTTLSSQFLICNGTSVGASLQQIRNSELDRDAYVDAYEPRLIAETRLGSILKVGGSVAYRTSSTKEDNEASPLTIFRVVSMAFGSVAITPQSRVGLTYFNYYARKKVENASHKIVGQSGELVGTFRF